MVLLKVLHTRYTPKYHLLYHSPQTKHVKDNKGDTSVISPSIMDPASSHPSSAPSMSNEMMLEMVGIAVVSGLAGYKLSSDNVMVGVVASVGYYSSIPHEIPSVGIHDYVLNKLLTTFFNYIFIKLHF